MANVKSIIRTVTGVATGIVAVGMGMNGLNVMDSKDKRGEIKSSFNLTSQEFNQIDKNISEAGKGKFFKTYIENDLWTKEVNSLNAKKQSLSIAANKKILAIKPSELTYEAGKKFVRDSLAAAQQKIKIIK